MQSVVAAGYFVVCLVPATPAPGPDAAWADEKFMLAIESKPTVIGNYKHRLVRGVLTDRAGDEVPLTGSAINGTRFGKPVVKISLTGTHQREPETTPPGFTTPGYFVMSLQFDLKHKSIKRKGVRDDPTTIAGYYSDGNIALNRPQTNWDIGVWQPIWHVPCD